MLLLDGVSASSFVVPRAAACAAGAPAYCSRRLLPCCVDMLASCCSAAHGPSCCRLLIAHMMNSRSFDAAQQQYLL